MRVSVIGGLHSYTRGKCRKYKQKGKWKNEREQGEGRATKTRFINIEKGNQTFTYICLNSAGIWLKSYFWMWREIAWSPKFGTEIGTFRLMIDVWMDAGLDFYRHSKFGVVKPKTDGSWRSSPVNVGQTNQRLFMIINLHTLEINKSYSVSCGGNRISHKKRLTKFHT